MSSFTFSTETDEQSNVYYGKIVALQLLTFTNDEKSGNSSEWHQSLLEDTLKICRSSQR